MSNIKRYIQNFMKYKDLLKQLVIRDIKVKYKRSILGILWSLLNPLMIMIVMTIVFSELFRFEIENFAAYLISGQVIFNFFTESTSLAMASIYNEGQLIKKVYIPKYIFPMSKVLFSFVNFIFSLIAITIVCIVTGVKVKFTVVFALLSMIYILGFSIGIGLILSSIAVFFRDIVHLYGVMITAWMYLTPIFYPIDIVPQKYVILVYINPLYYFVTHFREALIYGNIPSLQLNLICIEYMILSLLIGLYLFYKKQDSFILYI
ncbi:MAG: lipopolysaccharide transport system permease protein [Candidatus Petromonas sp.]|jgi:ABC-2 type transport system permease protein|nr:lipopolysaccharide transport system permease protein [Candidatus Petromonas sp.]